VTGSDSDNLALEVHRNRDGAVDRLVRSYQGRLFNYALRVLQNPFDAQEVAQDAFVRACRALTSRYDESKCRNLELGPWLFRITRNLAFTRRRARESRREVPVPDAGERPEDTLSHPAEATRELEAGEEQEVLRRALDRIGPEARELILLRFMEEMSYAEIASIVGTGEAAVRGKVFRALRKLRATLNKIGDINAL